MPKIKYSAVARYGVPFVNPASDWYSAWDPTIIYAVSYYIGMSYNSTPLYQPMYKYKSQKINTTFHIGHILCIAENSNISKFIKRSQSGLNPFWSLVFVGIHYHNYHCIEYIDGLVQEGQNSSALAMAFCLSCTYPSICFCLHHIAIIITLLSL